MHDEVLEFVADTVAGLPRLGAVAEFGSLNVNGTVRPLFGTCRYVGIDIAAGPGVDIVADAAAWTADQPADVVVCCEVLEHTAAWRDLIASAHRALRPGGTVIITCAGPGRGPHSAVDGNALRDGEHYDNIDPDHLAAALVHEGFTAVNVRQVGLDVQATAVRRR